MMKKVLAVLCVLMLCVTCFAACATDGEGDASTASPKATASAKATATPKATATQKVTESATATVAPTETPTQDATATATTTQTATEAPTPTPSAKPKVDYSVYTIDVDITIIDGNTGIVFAGEDRDNFLMWQLAIGEYNDGKLYLRPHEWTGNNPVALENIEVPSSVAAAEYDTTIHMQLQINDGTVTTYINGTEVDERDMDYTDYDMFGFRSDAYKDSTIMEVGAFDNVVIKNSAGEVVFSETFDSDDHYFSDYMEEGDGYVEDGKLVVGGEYKTLVMADMPS